MSGWQIGSYFSLFCFCINYHLFYHEYLYLLDLMYITAENYNSFKRSDNCFLFQHICWYFIHVNVSYCVQKYVKYLFQLWSDKS